MIPIMPTTVVGSYPKPGELYSLISAHKKGKITNETMKKAYRETVRSVVRDQEQAGVNILWDGEMGREEMTSYFARRILGFRIYGEVRVWGNNYYEKPSIVDELRYKDELVLEDFKFLQSITSKSIKVPITGPYTLVDWSFNEYYKSKAEAVYALARIENEELKKVVEMEACYIQLDEPAIPTHPDELEIVKNAIEIVTKGVRSYIGLHICYGDYSKIFPEILDFRIDQLTLEFANHGFSDIELLKQNDFTLDLGFGCVDVHTRRIESKEEIKENIRKILEFLNPKQIYINPDCGLKLLPREIALKKLKVMCQAALEMRKELK